jgi:hypothetical protein
MLPDPELRKLVCEALRGAFAHELDQYSGKSREEHAEEIGITRQAFEAYGRPLHSAATPDETGSVPRAHVLLLAMLRWGSFEVGLSIPGSPGSSPERWIFRAVKQTRHPATKQLPKKRDEQMLLPLEEAIGDLENSNVEVKIVRKGPHSIDLGLEIAFRKRSA